MSKLQPRRMSKRRMSNAVGKRIRLKTRDARNYSYYAERRAIRRQIAQAYNQHASIRINDSFVCQNDYEAHPHLEPADFTIGDGRYHGFSPDEIVNGRVIQCLNYDDDNIALLQFHNGYLLSLIKRFPRHRFPVNRRGFYVYKSRVDVCRWYPLSFHQMAVTDFEYLNPLRVSSRVTTSVKCCSCGGRHV